MCLPARVLSARTFVSGLFLMAAAGRPFRVRARRRPRGPDTSNMCQSQGLVPLVAQDDNIIPACRALLPPSLHLSSLFAAAPSLPLPLFPSLPLSHAA